MFSQTVWRCVSSGPGTQGKLYACSVSRYGVLSAVALAHRINCRRVHSDDMALCQQWQRQTGANFRRVQSEGMALCQQWHRHPGAKCSVRRYGVVSELAQAHRGKMFSQTLWRCQQWYRHTGANCRRVQSEDGAVSPVKLAHRG